MKLSLVTMDVATMVNAYEFDFTDVFEAHEFLTKKADNLFNSLSFETDKSKFKFDFCFFTNLEQLRKETLPETTRWQDHCRITPRPPKQSRITRGIQKATMRQESTKIRLKRSCLNHDESL